VIQGKNSAFVARAFLRPAILLTVFCLVFSDFASAAEQPSRKPSPRRSLRSPTYERGPRPRTTKDKPPVPVEAPPMRMRVVTPEGVLVIFDAASPREGDDECSGYLAYWLFKGDMTRFVFPGILLEPVDLATPLLALERDLGVDLEALADADERVGQALGSPAVAALDDQPWEPATVRRAVQIMGFDPQDDPDLDLPDHRQTAQQCTPENSCGISSITPGNCDSPSGLAREALAVADGCCPGGGGGGGGGGGPCTCCGMAAAVAGSASSENGTVVAVNCCPDATCDDGNPCTENDLCANPQVPNCGPTTCCGTPKVCDDGNICTNDWCKLPSGSCMNTPYCTGGVCCAHGQSFSCCWPPTTQCCAEPDHCCEPDQTCCGAGCCPPERPQCCENPNHCCEANQTCCPGGTQCCNPDQTCCNGVCGLKGACCFFETGSCLEKTELCCQQEGGVFQADRPTCTPADLCRPRCENCHAISGTFAECEHGMTGPCDPTGCIRNTINTVGCDAFPYRRGPRECNTVLLSSGTYMIQEHVPLTNMSCAPTNPGGFHVWMTLWAGCGDQCVGENQNVRCDVPDCVGDPDEPPFPRGPATVCGCP